MSLIFKIAKSITEKQLENVMPSTHQYVQNQIKNNKPSVYNIAVIGQTGVGKSSLINYLFGQEVCKTGTGRPVTTNGFHIIKHHIKDMPVNIYDSWGLEVGKEEQWLKELNDELKNRGIDKEATEWFHSVFYCISASGARIQDADIKIIKQLLAAKYKVSIILTKTDSLEEDEEKQFKKEISKVLENTLNTSLPIISVCSTRKKLRGSQDYIEPFGKEDIEKQSIIDFIDSLILRIPVHCESVMKKELKDWQSKMSQEIRDNIGFMGSGSESMQNRLENESKRLAEHILKVGRDAHKASVKHYEFIIQNVKKEMVHYNQSEYQDYIKFDETNFDWSILFGIFTIFAWPFALIHEIINGRDGAVDKLLKALDGFVFKVEQRIEEQTFQIEQGFKAIQEKVKKDLLV